MQIRLRLVSSATQNRLQRATVRAARLLEAAIRFGLRLVHALMPPSCTPSVKISALPPPIATQIGPPSRILLITVPTPAAVLAGSGLPHALVPAIGLITPQAATFTNPILA